MWLYNNTPINTIEAMPEGTFGFIYITTHIPTGKRYLGKKSLYHSTNQKLGKKELAEQPITRGRAKTTKLVIKESDWKTYYGSADSIKLAIKNKQHDEFTREIIQTPIFLPSSTQKTLPSHTHFVYLTLW
jgi:hypothetical protein